MVVEAETVIGVRNGPQSIELNIKLNSNNNKMEYSELIGAASYSKFSPDSSFFIHFEGSKLYVWQLAHR
jgi:hypothetical protein